MGGGIARVDCVCVLLVAQTRVRSLVACGGCIFLRCFVGGVDDCGGRCDGKEVSMWYLYVIFAIVLFCFGGLFALVILEINNTDIKRSNDEPFLRLAYMAIDLLVKYSELKSGNKELNEYLHSHKGGVVPPNKKYEDFITRSETVVDIDKLKDEFEKEQQKQ